MAENKAVLTPEDNQDIREKGMKKYDPDKSIRLTEEARDTLRQLKRKPGLLAHASLQAIREAVGADAFDSLTLDRMHKQMLAGYKEYEPQWPKLVSKTTSINDFRTRYSIIHSGFNRLPEVKAKEPYKELQYSDDSINWTPKKYGGMYGYSFEASTYDDLGMFDDDVRKLGQATNRTYDYFFFYTCLDANPTSYDGSNAIFGTVGSTAGTFANTMTTTGLNYTNLETAVTTMLQQTQLDSSSTFTDANYMPAMYIPKYLVVHPSDLLTAKRMLYTPNWPGKADNDVNVLPELEILVTPYIAATHWYLMADPAQGANTMEAGLWGGNATPELFYEPANTGHGFAFDEVRSKIRTIFGGAVLDPRAWILGST